MATKSKKSDKVRASLTTSFLEASKEVENKVTGQPNEEVSNKKATNKEEKKPEAASETPKTKAPAKDKAARVEKPEFSFEDFFIEDPGFKKEALTSTHISAKKLKLLKLISDFSDTTIRSLVDNILADWLNSNRDDIKRNYKIDIATFLED